MQTRGVVGERDGEGSLRSSRASGGGDEMIDKQLLEILACPKCKSPVKQDGEKLICQNAQCGLKYPIRDGIPVMLIDEAEKPATK
jgi:uncharacterized protein YbaR (Trm112 family)